MRPGKFTICAGVTEVCIDLQSLQCHSRLFEYHPECFTSGSYKIETQAPVDLQLKVLSFIESNAPLEITSENSALVSQLANEFGLAALAASADDTPISSRVVDPLSCLTDFIFHGKEEQLQTFEKRISRLEHFSEGSKVQATLNDVNLRLDSLEPHFRTEIHLPADEGLPLSGILSYLTRKYQGNVHDRNVVNITASSIYRQGEFWEPKNIADPTPQTVFGSDDKAEQWICFDFKKLLIKPTHYAIRSSCYPVGGSHLKSWVIECAKDGKDWIEIDRHENLDDLNWPRKLQMFHVRDENESRFLRLRQIGKNHGENDILELSGFEVFGILRE